MTPLPVPPLPFLSFLNKRDHDAAPALHDGGSSGWLSFGELHEKIVSLLPSLPATPRGLVFCLLPRTVEGALAYLTAAASGYALMMLDPGTPRLDGLIEAYQPEWIILPEKSDLSISNLYRRVRLDLAGLALWQRTGTASSSPHPDVFLLLLTSGSTGGRKAVRLSYANLAHNTDAIIASLDLTARERALLHLPLAYSFGLSVLNMQLAAGGSVLLTDHSPVGRDMWDLARAQEATLFAGVPTHYEMLARLGLDRLQVPMLKTFLQAGGKMPLSLTEDLLRQVQARQGKLFVMYGQTEAGPRLTCLPLHKMPEKIGAAGYALKDGKLAIEDGEIVYTGPNVMMGYAEGRADLALGDTQRGRLATGDLGQLDSGGCLRITGRKQRFAKLFGERIALDDLEQLARVVVTAYALEGADKIVLMTTDKDAATHRKLKDHLVKSTGIASPWLEVRAIDAVPYQTTGKVDYRQMREWL